MLNSTEYFPTCRLWSKAGELLVTRNYNSPEMVFTRAEFHLYYIHGSSKADMNFWQFKKAAPYTSLQIKPLENTKVLKG